LKEILTVTVALRQSHLNAAAGRRIQRTSERVQAAPKGVPNMIRKFVVTLLTLGAALGLAFSTAPAVVAAHDSSASRVFGSVNVAPGEHLGDVATVNGSVNVGSDAVVGHAHTVNGGIHLESRSTAADLTAVNGGIHVEESGRVTGDVHTVNGGLHIQKDADVTGDVGNVNGNIHVESAHVGGSVITTNGNMDLGPNARIDGDVVMKENHGDGFTWGHENIPHVLIEPGTVVKGELRFERKVILYVSDRATIGAVHGADVVKFSGDHPPQNWD
jgi:cytoskeletal protein CcmA (bactofilin family)